MVFLKTRMRCNRVPRVLIETNKAAAMASMTCRAGLATRAACRDVVACLSWPSPASAQGATHWRSA